MPPTNSCLLMGPPSRELTEAFCRVPLTWFSQAPWYTLPVHLCRFRVRSDGGLFPGTSKRPTQSDKGRQPSRSVTSHWPRNINLVPIDYAFRPRLRGRLTLLRLALSRNPWSFGGRVSHPPIATHVCIRTSDTSTTHYQIASSAYGTLRYRMQ